MSTNDPEKKPTDPQAAYDSPEKEGSEPVNAAQGGTGEAGEDQTPKKPRWKQVFVWFKANYFRTATIGLFLVLAVLSGVVLSLLGVDQSSSKNIQKAMESLEKSDIFKAKKIAKQMTMQPETMGQDPTEAAFILAMAAADDAEAGWPDDRSSYLLAARYFDIAYPDGFPKNFSFLGLKTYGKVLLRCDRFIKSRKILEEALKVAETESEKNEVRYLLVEADLSVQNPDLTEATRLNNAYLKSKELTEQERIDGAFQQLQLLIRQGKFEKARMVLEKLPKNAATFEKIYYAQGRLTMREAEVAQADGKKSPEQIRAEFEKAIKSFRRAQGYADESSPTVPKTQYLIGLCLEQLGENRAAIRQWKQVCEFFPNSPEAVASRYRLAKIYFQEEATEQTPREAIKDFKRVVSTFAREEYSNPWITASEVRKNAADRIEAFRKEEKLRAALGMAEAVMPLMAKLSAIRLLATLNRDLGQSVLDQIKPNTNDKEQDRQRSEARQYFRTASLLFAELARQGKTTRTYPDDLWESAECALKGNDFVRAARTFTMYLNVEPVKRNAAALLGLGEAYLALGEIDEAIDTFQQCIEFFPTDVATFRARLLAAGAWQEKGDLKPAEQLLLENWASPGITPQSLVWRETLYHLGELYHDTKDYDKAIQRLEDAVRRFPDDPRTNFARYMLADSYRLLADEAQIRIKKTMTRSKLSAQKANIESDLNNAYRQYQLLQQQIGAKRGMRELSDMDNRLLRNSRIFAAGVLFQLQQYDRAIKVYSTASLHYQGQPISLQTMKQNAQALIDLGKYSQAQNLLRQIRKQLEKMGPDLPYEETTLYSYDEWIKEIQEMEKEISMQ